MSDRWLSIYPIDGSASICVTTTPLPRVVLQLPGERWARIIRSPNRLLAIAEILEAVMRQLDVPPSVIKVGLVRVAERLARLKLNGRLFKRSPLSHIVELEVLVVGMRAKEALWSALLTTELSLQGIDLDALVKSARSQAGEVDELRLGAVAETFGRNLTREAYDVA
jgi:hypothetical protein